MTGTALTEEEEFRQIYKLDVIEIPTNKPVARKDNPDVVYKNERGKIKAIIDAHRGMPRQGPAGPGRHGLHRESPSELSKMLKRQGHQAHRPERQVPRAARRRSSRRRASRARSPSRPTWPAAARTSCSAATPNTMAHDELKKAPITAPRAAHQRGQRPRGNRRRRDSRQAREVSRSCTGKYKQETDSGRGKGPRGGRPVYPRYRAARIPPHRQPAARPCRPSGRPGRILVLYLAGGRPDASVRFGKSIQNMMDSLGIEEDEPIDAENPVRARSKTRRKRSNPATLPPVSMCLQYDDVLNTPARDHLQPAPAGA